MAFNIGTFAEASQPVEHDDLDFSAFKDNPLSPETVRTLTYMCDVEYHTVCYMRDMLVTPSHNDPDVGTFMTVWNREEYWHGNVLAQVLKMHGVTVEYDEIKANRLKLGWKDRLDPIKQALLGNLVGKDFIAVHMSWGAANERSAAAGYKRLAALEPHPVLAPLLKRVAAQESRHIAFYTTQAKKRLEASPKAQKFTRFALNKFWAPVGSGVMAQTEVEHMMEHLFSDAEGWAEIRKIDAQIAELPGLKGLKIMENAFKKQGLKPTKA